MTIVLSVPIRLFRVGILRGLAIILGFLLVLVL